jgi:hypothetical protein
MIKPNIFQNEQSEQAFRTWQNKHSGRLMTHWTVSTEKENGMEYDIFCLKVYTGRIKAKVN